MAAPRSVPECYALAAQELGGEPPEWLLLLPAGPAVRLRDGRAFASAGAAAVVAEWQRQGLDLPVDLNHAEVHFAPYGGDSPAYGWVTAMEVRAGAAWGRVEWTDEGRQTITARRYRYYSPTFSVMRTARGGREIVGITSVALVNRPALPGIAALAREESNMKDGIRAALGLAEEATEQQVVEAIALLKQPPATAAPAAAQSQAGAPAADGAAPAAGQETVPVADYQLVAARARTAEDALRARDEADLKAEAEAAVDGAVRERKIAPASRGYHLEGCRTRTDLDRFKAFAASAPELIPAGSAAPAGQPPTDSRSPEEIEVDRQLGTDSRAGQAAGAPA